MLRIGSMNMLLHGVENPDIRYKDSLAESDEDDAEKYSLILANPPFVGSLDYVFTPRTSSASSRPGKPNCSLGSFQKLINYRIQACCGTVNAFIYLGMQKKNTYVKSAERGFFDSMDRLSHLDSMSDPLANLDAIMDWNIFLPVLDRIPRAQANGPGGRPAYHPMYMFKILVLQSLYGLSDEQTQFQILAGAASTASWI